MRRLPARDPAQRSCQVQHRAGFSTRDVQRAAPQVGSSQGKEIRSRDVAYVDEIPELSPILVDNRALLGLDRTPKDACNPGVRRVAWHSRAVHVVISKRNHRDVVFAPEKTAEVLLVQLARRVDVSRVERRLFEHSLGLNSATAPRACRIPLPRLEVPELTRCGTHKTIERTTVRTLPVDDHAARQDDASGKVAVVKHP